MLYYFSPAEWKGYVTFQRASYMIKENSNSSDEYSFLEEIYFY